VFDPGLNALSILTRIRTGALALKRAEFPTPKRETPIAASLLLDRLARRGGTGRADFARPAVKSGTSRSTRCGRMHLFRGGRRMAVNGLAVETVESRDYAVDVRAFCHPRPRARIEVDSAPLQLVADAFLCGRRVEVEPFLGGVMTDN